MKRTALIALASASLALGASAQPVYTELPGGGWTNQVTQIYDTYLATRTAYLPLHIQYAYNTADIANAGLIKSLAWRRNNYFGNAMPAGGITTTITMALSPLSPANMSSTFATNLAVVPTQVFQGTTSWPAVNKGTGPAPWTHTVTLSTPFPFAKLPGSLIVDLQTTASTGYTTSTYTIDASGPDLGVRSNNGTLQSNCKFSNGNWSGGGSYTTGGMTNNGGPWYFSYSGILPGAPGAGFISVNGVDNPGPWPLPINLTPILMPNCFWNVGLNATDILAVPIPPANANGTATWPTLQIPPGLGGFSFYEQAIFLDAAANPAGFVPSLSGKYYIGTLKGPDANTLYRTADTSGSPTGTLKPGYGTALRVEQ